MFQPSPSIIRVAWMGSTGFYIIKEEAIFNGRIINSINIINMKEGSYMGKNLYLYFVYVLLLYES